MLRSLLLVLALAATAQADSLRVISWNVESGGANPAVIARQLAALPEADAYVLQEVSPQDIGRYAAAIRKAHGESYKYYLGSLGGADRLAIIVNESRFAIRSFSELFGFRDYRLNDWRHRSPLVAHLHPQGGGEDLLLVTVHLARGNERLRTEQATGLREWAQSLSLPVVLAGDCNFDFNFRSQRGNKAYDAFFKKGIWSEVKPSKRIDTNWSDRDGDGRDNYPNSALDFVALCSNGRSLSGLSRVIVREGDFPDNETSSDHRPIWAEIEIEP